MNIPWVAYALLGFACGMIIVWLLQMLIEVVR